MGYIGLLDKDVCGLFVSKTNSRGGSEVLSPDFEVQNLGRYQNSVIKINDILKQYCKSSKLLGKVVSCM